ncbi:uncharacterized protein [Montipora foliosa]
MNTMVELKFLRISLGLVVLISFLMPLCFANSCPSPAVVYASKGDTVTICWKNMPDSSKLKRIHVMALFRPVDEVMERVASANKTGHHIRTYDDYHHGLYVGRVDLYPDPKQDYLYLKLFNYTDKMENIYCVIYQMSGVDDVKECHANAILLRTYSEGDSATSASIVKAPATCGECDLAPQTFKIAFIIVASLTGVLT